MKSKKLLVWLSACFSLGAVSEAQAARFPNAVEKTISLKGEAAGKLAALLGLSRQSPSLKLSLAENDSWAVYLLKQDTKEKLWNANQGMPERVNTIELKSGAAPEILIGPFWLDLASKAPAPQKGAYSFSSCKLSFQKDEAKQAWAPILDRLRKESGTKSEFSREFVFDDKSLLRLQLYQVPGNNGQSVLVFTVQNLKS